MASHLMLGSAWRFLPSEWQFYLTTVAKCLVVGGVLGLCNFGQLSLKDCGPRPTHIKCHEIVAAIQIKIDLTSDVPCWIRDSNQGLTYAIVQ